MPRHLRGLTYPSISCMTPGDASAASIAWPPPTNSAAAAAHKAVAAVSHFRVSAADAMTVAAWIWHMVYQAARRVVRAFCRVVSERTAPMAPQWWKTTAGHGGPRKAAARSRGSGGGGGDGNERREPTSAPRAASARPGQPTRPRPMSGICGQSAEAHHRSTLAERAMGSPSLSFMRRDATQCQVRADALGQELDANVTSTSTAAAAAAAAAHRSPRRHATGPAAAWRQWRRSGEDLRQPVG